MKKEKEITKLELLRKIKLLNPESKEQRNTLVCALIGHSMIQTTCFGYFHCGRCGDQLGDNLGSIYSAAEHIVVIGHNCPKCRTNYKKLSWKDKLYIPDPFKKKS